jgi:hypothetical protein
MIYPLTSTRLAEKVGLLSKDNVEQVPFAYKLYNSSGKSNETLARGFKQTFCRVVPIEFVGVWWADLSSLCRKWKLIRTIDPQGNDYERGSCDGPIFAFCGREYNNSGIQTRARP